ncbi:MAG: iron-sulfur cluster assembly accessory protein [Cyclobacteriaceae bacterium]|nr:iron-sulfur cluster assembly accessory protein [Cyclobacteriaceae bacterium]
MLDPINITPRALKQIQAILESKEIDENYALRVGVNSGSGCGAMNYLLGFDEQNEEDKVYDIEGVKVLIEKKQTMFIIGMTIDFVDEGEQSGFTFIKNAKQPAG